MAKFTSISLENFTAFKNLELFFNKGINIIIGSNGTGKTHILKTLYSACSITDGEDREKTFSQKLVNVFRPYENRVGRLAHRGVKSVSSKITIKREKNSQLSAVFSNHTKSHDKMNVIGEDSWKKSNISCAYIPVKEMLSHAPGFLATMSKRELAFEEVYSDIVKRAYLPKLKGPVNSNRAKILKALQDSIEGKISTKGEFFFLKNKQGELEFTLLSEGIRKLALIWLLTQNGVLTNGSILFWDEPEANLNPSRMGEVVEVILELQRIGVQIFISTHNYVLLKEFELRKLNNDDITYISLYRDVNDEISAISEKNYQNITENKISDTLNNIYDREIDRTISKMKI